MMAARHTPFVHERVKSAKVGIAGLGGLGSNIAVMLARTGIGELVLADFDLVEPSNLNRPALFYFPSRPVQNPGAAGNKSARSTPLSR